MNYELIIISGIFALCFLFFTFFINSRLRQQTKNLANQSALLLKIHSVLKSKQATNAVAENADIVYQTLLAHAAILAGALEIAPRQTNEHQLWQTLGGIMDAYATNPYVLQQLRQAIKLDSNVARAAEGFAMRANELLASLQESPILANSFADGLLGQTITLIASAKEF